MATPRNMAMPPNLGMAFLCMRLESFGTSMAPTLGATLMAKGVSANDAMNAIKNDKTSVL